MFQGFPMAPQSQKQFRIHFMISSSTDIGLMSMFYMHALKLSYDIMIYIIGINLFIFNLRSLSIVKFMRRVDFPQFGVVVASGSLLKHRQSQHGVDRGGQGRVPPPPNTPQGGPNLPGIFPKIFFAAPLPNGGVPGRFLKSVQPPGSLCAPPRTVHKSYPVGGGLTIPQVPPV